MVQRLSKLARPKPLRILRVNVADKTWKPPKAFAFDQLSFNAEPLDQHLVALLGSSDWSGVHFESRDGLLVARHRLIPMKFVVPWLLFIAGATTSLPWTIPMFGSEVDNMLLAFILFMWFGPVPGLIGFFYYLNAHFSSLGDYFRATPEALELPSLGITIHVADIAYLVEVRRWYHGAGEYRRDRILSVLVRRSGHFDLMPVVRDEIVWLKPPIADQLSAILRKQVRRIELSFRESRAIRDDR